MSGTLTYKCDDCGMTADWEDSRGWVRIEVKRFTYGSELPNRDYCVTCWAKRKQKVLEAVS